ncbi:MAG: KEOPS complex subunit Cgi121 [Candidatus Hydrothermarchaeales archaeon]
MHRFPIGGKGLKIIALRCSHPVYKETFKEYLGVQAIDADLLFGVEHVEFAAKKAKKAFENGENISNNLFVETIVRASGQRQIKKAMEMFGLRGSKEIVIFGEEVPEEVKKLLEAESFEIRMDGGRLEILKEAFSITDAEIMAVSDHPAEAIKELIKERVSLVSTL